MSPRLVAAAQGYASAATAASTRRAYASSWATFQRWCDEKDLVALPAEPASVALFLADLAENSVEEYPRDGPPTVAAEQQ